MDLNGATMPSVSRQDSIDLLDMTLLSLAHSYVRSYDCKKRYNVNASYYTVSLLTKERRQKLVVTIAAILGDDSRYWFAPSLKPVNLPAHPLDWSTILLRQLCTFAESLPLDVRNTAIDQRLVLAHQTMLTESAKSPRSDGSTGSAKTRQPDKDHSVSNENVRDLRTQNVNLSDELRALRNEMTNMAEQKAVALSKCEDELEELRKDNAWTERRLAIRDKEAGADSSQ